MSQKTTVSQRETLLRSYTKRLKDDVKSILDNYTEIIKTVRVGIRSVLFCFFVVFFLKKIVDQEHFYTTWHPESIRIKLILYLIWYTLSDILYQIYYILYLMYFIWYLQASPGSAWVCCISFSNYQTFILPNLASLSGFSHMHCGISSSRQFDYRFLSSSPTVFWTVFIYAVWRCSWKRIKCLNWPSLGQ